LSDFNRDGVTDLIARTPLAGCGSTLATAPANSRPAGH